MFFHPLNLIYGRIYIYEPQLINKSGEPKIQILAEKKFFLNFSFKKKTKCDFEGVLYILCQTKDPPIGEAYIWKRKGV